MLQYFSQLSVRAGKSFATQPATEAHMVQIWMLSVCTQLQLKLVQTGSAQQEHHSSWVSLKTNPVSKIRLDDLKTEISQKTTYFDNSV